MLPMLLALIFLPCYVLSQIGQMNLAPDPAPVSLRD
jgi:hypothetical protein